MANLGYLQLTRNCYQHCRFCSNPPTGVDLSIDEMRELIDGLAEMDYDGVILTGGEPTLSPLLKPALEYAAEKGLYSRMITNGQLLADRAFFQEVVDAGLRQEIRQERDVEFRHAETSGPRVACRPMELE